MISTKFLKSFRGARDLVVFSEVIRAFFKLSKFTTKSRAPLLLSGLISLDVFWLNFEKNQRFLFCTVKALFISSNRQFCSERGLLSLNKVDSNDIRKYTQIPSFDRQIFYIVKKEPKWQLSCNLHGHHGRPVDHHDRLVGHLGHRPVYHRDHVDPYLFFFKIFKLLKSAAHTASFGQKG